MCIRDRDHRSRNLRLYHRLTDVLTKDRTFAVAASRFRDRHDELTGLYRIRLDHAMKGVYAVQRQIPAHPSRCLLYTSDAADERSSVDLGGRRIF